ncbi:MAG: flagellar motor switch protein FliN [Lachnospiraceae bacterium]|jgi:flagellar motor switch protein FliN/FliY|nr:flagellar motor switch protein FliN [Lachnospiraceae bacterium]
MGANSFNEMEIDAIGEIMNISLGASATAVSTMLGTAVNITTPVVRILTGDQFEYKKLEPAVGVEIAYVKGLDGRNIMMFSRNDVRIIVGMMMGEEIPPEAFELDEMNRSAICEVMNQMMGSSATALSEFLGMPVDISTPVSFEVESEAVFKEKYFPGNSSMVVVRFSLEIEGQLKSEFFNILSEPLVKRLLEPFQVSMSQAAEPAPAPEPAPEPEPEGPGAQKVMSQADIEALMKSAQAEEPAPSPEPSGGMMSQAEIEALMQASQPAAPQPEPQTAAPAAPQAPAPQPVPQAPVPQPGQMPYPAYQAAPDPLMLQLLNQMQQSQMQMMEMMNSMKEKAKEPQRSSEPSLIRPMSSLVLEDDGGDGVESRTNQEMLMKVPLEISVEIGRTKKLVKDILEFTQGSLVVLDKMAGEQADLYVNGQCIAKGDIVVVEDNFGIRITEIVARNLIPESL